MTNKRKYDSTVARIAGNILSGQKWPTLTDETRQLVAHEAVLLARAIVAAVERTEPEQESV